MQITSINTGFDSVNSGSVGTIQLVEEGHIINHQYYDVVKCLVATTLI